MTVSPVKKTAEPIQIPLGLLTWVGPLNHVAYLMGSRFPHVIRDNFEGEQEPARIIAGHVRWSVYSARGRTGPVLMPIGLDLGAYWRNLSNTIGQSVCGGDAALCQITLTTCFFIISRFSTVSIWPIIGDPIKML